METAEMTYVKVKVCYKFLESLKADLKIEIKFDIKCCSFVSINSIN